MVEINNPEVIKRILDECKTIAVVGLSSNPIRPSYGVARYMQQRGYRIIPVNPNETEVLGEQAYASLADAPERFDLVDIFRRSEDAAMGPEDCAQFGSAPGWFAQRRTELPILLSGRPAAPGPVSEGKLVHHRRLYDGHRDAVSGV